MKLDTSILVPGSPGLCSAREWNKFAKTINTLWNSRATEGVTLTKGETWIFEAGDGGSTTSSINANGPIYRVYVWRGDKWDFGSNEIPNAFFLGGDFTEINGLPATRLARIKKDLSGHSELDTAFSVTSGFDSSVLFINSTKDDPPQLVVGCPLPTLRTGEDVYSMAWTLDPADGTFGSGNVRVTWATGPWQFGTLPLQGVACIADRIGLLGASLFRQFQISTGDMGYGSSSGQHLLDATTSRWIITGDGSSMSYVIPAVAATDCPGYIDANCTQSADWETNYGGAPMFNVALNPKQVWDASSSGREIWFSASNETGGALTWGAYGNYVDGEDWSAALICVTDDGLIADGENKRLKLIHGTTDRADLCCVDTHGVVWFCGDVFQIKSNTTDTGYNPLISMQLYTFDPATQAIQVFNNFNGRVWDCQQFGEDQYIVVGEFTEYKGQPASYIVFIDGSGKRIYDVSWPS